MAIPVIQPPFYGFGQVGRLFNLNLHALNNATFWADTGLNLPPGVTVVQKSPGVWAVRGTPTGIGGIFNSNITASNNDGSDVQSFEISAYPVGFPFYVGPTTLTFPSGTPISLFLNWQGSGITAYGMCDPTSLFGDCSLPDGILFDTTSGEIHGTPTTAGTYSEIFIQARNDPSGLSENAITIIITDGGGGGGIPVINSSLVETAALGDQYTYNILATNSPTQFQATGMPLGMTCNTHTGVIHWPVDQEGEFDITLVAQNAAGPSDPAIMVLTVGTTGGGGVGGGGGGGGGGGISGSGTFTYQEINSFAEDILAACPNLPFQGIPPDMPSNFIVTVSGTPGDTNATASWTTPDDNI